MAKDKTAYVCSNCGQESPKWIGKCPACGQWNTFKEIKVDPSAPPKMGGTRGGLGNGSISQTAASAGIILPFYFNNRHIVP